MEKAFAKVEELAAAIKEYADLKIDTVKLNTAEKASGVIANMAAGAVVAVVFILFAGFAGIALALLLGTWIGKLWAGFLIVACFYLLLGIIAWTARERLIRIPLINAMIEQLFKIDGDEED